MCTRRCFLSQNALFQANSCVVSYVNDENKTFYPTSLFDFFLEMVFSDEPLMTPIVSLCD